MQKAKVYYLPQDAYAKVPELIQKVSGDIYKKGDFVALKIHFGEKGNKGYIKPEWVKPVVNVVKNKGAYPFLTDTNTIYRGQRADAVNHTMMALGHGFKIEKVGAPVIIADGLRGHDFVDVPIKGKHFTSLKIARGIFDAHSMIVLSHLKGHILTGYGGALKNLGMGCAAKGAKYEMHAGMYPTLAPEKCIGCGECIKWCAARALTLPGGKINLDKSLCAGCGECILACIHEAIDIPWDASASKVQEALVEYAYGAVKDKPVCYVNYMHHISEHCDCWSTNNPVLLDDQGILVSIDPVAIDQAGIDIINKAAGKDLFKEVHPGVDYNVQLLYAEKLGMGSREYELIGAEDN
jgi:hypothetical protein